MRFGFAIFAVLCLLNPLTTDAYSIPVTAKAAIIMDAQSGKVLWAKNPHLKLPPASTTKVLTGIVAMEYAEMSKVCVVSKKAADTQASKINLKPGDELPVHDLLYALLLKSANDAGVVLAENIGGSESRFASLMNAKAEAIGARDSHFVNPHGLPAKNHYTTAYDLSLMLRYAISKPEFNRVAETREYIIDLDRHPVKLKNHNRLLWTEEGAGAGKTGYTRQAKHCYVGEINRDGAHIIVAILASQNPWKDLRMLINRASDLHAKYTTGDKNRAQAGEEGAKRGA